MAPPAPPKTQKLLREEQKVAEDQSIIESITPKYIPGEPIKIKEVPCANECVAILQFRVQTNIVLGEDAQHKNEGMIIGTGPGLPGLDGKRCPSQFKLGDVVVFQDKYIITQIAPKEGVYVNQKVIIMSEKSILFHLDSVPFKVLSPEEIVKLRDKK